MKKNFFSFLLSLALISGAPVVIAQSPIPVQGQNGSAQNLDDSMVGSYRPCVTITSSLGTRVQIYCNSLNNNNDAQIFYLQDPFIKVDPQKCYNPETQNLTIQVGFPCKLEEIDRILKSKNISGRLVEMPMVGYELTVSYGDQQQLIRSYRGAVEISDSISCNAIITNKTIMHALENDIDNVNINAKIFCEYKQTYGSSIRMGFSSKLSQKLEEKIKAFKNEVFMSRESFYNYVREVYNDVIIDLRNEGYIEVTGHEADDLFETIINQNSGMFTEKNLDEIGKLTGNLVIYDKDFASKELTPNEISDIKNEYEKNDELKKHIVTHWKSLQDIRRQSKDIEDFKDRVIRNTSISGSGGGGFNFCGILSANASASGGGSYLTDKSSSHYTFTWKDLYDMAAQESFNEQDFYSKSVEKYKGEVRKLLIQPKDYKVMRIGNSESNSGTKFYLQQTLAIGIVTLPKTFQVRIGDIIKREAERKHKEEVVAKAKAAAEAASKAAAEAATKANAAEASAAKVGSEAATRAAAEAAARAKAAAEAAAKAKAAAEATATAATEEAAKAKAAAEEAAKAKAEAETAAKTAGEAAIKATVEAAAWADLHDLSIPGKYAGHQKLIIVNGVTYVFRWVPAGTFMMGSPSREVGHINNETQHLVTLTKGFWMLQTEVTVGMFKSFFNSTGYQSQGDRPIGWKENGERINVSSWQNPGYYQDNNYPVTCVSWYDAVAFCKWFSETTKLTGSLPTESQWEYACRAGNQNRHVGYYLSDVAWYATNSNRKVHPVGIKPPNAWGLHDMHGNEREWCLDWLAVYPNGHVTDPVGQNSASGQRVNRGGSWGCPVEECRSARRDSINPSYRSAGFGFRFVVIPK